MPIRVYMKYALENQSEAARLEKQSQSPSYDANADLNGFFSQETKAILDAGCGSGIVARSVAKTWPGATVHGVDASKERITFAKEAANETKNIEFFTGNLTSKLPGNYDRIFCRFVLEHMPEKQQVKAIKTMTSSLNPGGKIRLIDLDGYLFNIFPVSKNLSKCFEKFEKLNNVDLYVGRKMASHLVEAGLENVSWEIKVMQMNTPQLMKEEIGLIEERFQNTLAFMTKVLGSKAKATSFQKEYLDTLRQPGSTLFYNKFVVTGTKPRHLRLVK